MEHIVIYTDGAIHGNGKTINIGGWGAVLQHGEQKKLIQGKERNTTNNRMEMLAAIKALELLKEPCMITLFTDSQYLLQGITVHIKKWKLNGMLNFDGDPVRNADMWERLDWLNQFHTIDWQWVKGHSGVEGNELADRLASSAIGAPSK